MPKQSTKNSSPTIRLLKIAGSVVLVIIGSVVLIVTVFLLFPDFFVNRFAKGKIQKEFTAQYPAYSLEIGTIHFSAWDNFTTFDSVVLTSKDSNLTCAVASVSLRDIDWMRLLRGEDSGHFACLDSTRLTAEGIVGTFAQKGYELQCERLQISVPDSEIIAEGVVGTFVQKGYRLQCERLHISVPDSEITADSIDFRPLKDDEDFFADSKFRRTRFFFTLPQARIHGSRFSDLIEGKKYSARSIEVRNLALDVLINKEKPSKKDSVSPPMPHEIFSSIAAPFGVDTITIINGQLLYGERFVIKGKPASISLDDLDVTMNNISNQGDTAKISAQGKFMKTGIVNLQMVLPLSGPDFSLQYSGSVQKMNLDALNPFLVIAEKLRIKSGFLREGSFNIRITRGHAQGNVHAIYKDLTVAKLDKETLKEGGIIEQITSFLANLLKLRKNNFVEKSSDPPKVGKVKYITKSDDPFFRVLWFSLRSGVGDIVGF